MSSLYHATGIVLGSRDHREADRWYTVFTKEQGKIELLARGGSKALAKLTPHLDSPAEVHLLVVRGRQYDTVAGVERLQAFPRAQKDLSRLLLLQNAFALLAMGTHTAERDENLYEALREWCQFVEEAENFSQERAGFAFGAFGLKLLGLLGYRPELLLCLSCRAGISAGEFQWHALKGGVVCSACRAKDPEQWFASRSVPDDAVKLLRYALKEPFPAMTRPHLTGTTLAAFHETVESLIVAHFPTIPAASLRAACMV